MAGLTRIDSVQQKILITGGAGFVGAYICQEMLDHGYEVICIDNFSKYGYLEKGFYIHPNFRLINGDCKNHNLMLELASEVDYIIAGAAMIGGISYFHRYAYDLLSENEKILASTFDAAINSFKNHRLKRILVISSSMVFESTNNFPTPESEVKRCPPPLSTYGFQKLSSEYFAKGAWEQYRLPYTVIRPFNAVGLGEGRARDSEVVSQGELTLALSHVLPDLAQKLVKGQKPLQILGSGKQIRCYTHAKDISRGIRLALESSKAINEDFNISAARVTSVMELARLVWNFLRPEEEFAHELIEGFEYDVQERIPDVTKARQVLGFEAEIGLESSVEEVCTWVQGAVSKGLI